MPPMFRVTLAIALATLACGDDASRTSEVASPADGLADAVDDVAVAEVQDVDAAEVDLPGLPRIHRADPVAAARGAEVLGAGWPGRGVIPELALRHLYLAWTEDLLEIYAFYTDPARYWPAMRERYGLQAAPAGDLPVGLAPSGDGMVSVTCLLCHEGRSPDGELVVGLGNARLDLQGLYDDLITLPAAFEALRQRPLPEPYKTLVASIPVPSAPPPIPAMTRRTGAAGATDAMGLGIALGALAAGRDGVAARLGFQTPAPWWTTAFKPRRYADGSVVFGGHRTMMATLLGLGMDEGQLVSLDAAFADVEHYLVTLAPPRWPFDPPDPSAVAAGRELFRARCSACHGTYEAPGAAFPDRVVALAEVGTDPLRVTAFGEDEEAVVNALIRDPDHPMRRTGGYLAPPLSGIWASAPYFHNGAVPDLLGVLDSSARPARWRRTGDGPAEYDRERVGWRFEVPASPTPSDRPPATVEARRIHETGQPGLSNRGHTMGDGLGPDERRALLAYLVTL